MRLIDADELKKKLKLWAFNNVTTTSPTFDFVTEFDIDECPTVCDLEQIRAKVEKVFCMSVVTNRLRTPMEVKTEILQIIDNYIGEDIKSCPESQSQ